MRDSSLIAVVVIIRALAIGLAFVALGAGIVLLGGCQTAERLPELPKVVEVQVTKYVPVPENLTKPCDEITKSDNTVGEAVRLANSRLESIRECNGRMEKIRSLGK